jgi:hypothetical protein
MAFHKKPKHVTLKWRKRNFHSRTVHLDIIKVFSHQLMHKWTVLKTILKFTFKTAPTCFGAITFIGERIIGTC